MPCNRNREIDDALARLAEQAGALVEFKCRGKGRHRRVYFMFNGQSRFNVLPNTPSSGGVLHQAVGQAKRTLRGLGASFEIPADDGGEP
jgi:hypothetical protein